MLKKRMYVYVLLALVIVSRLVYAAVSYFRVISNTVTGTVMVDYTWTAPSPTNTVYLSFRYEVAQGLKNQPFLGQSWVYALGQEAQTTASGTVVYNLINGVSSGTIPVNGLVSSPAGQPTMVQGQYLAKMYFQDSLGLETVSANAMVYVDTETVPANVVSPVNNGLYNGVIPIRYFQSEAAKANSISMSFEGPANTVLLMNSLMSNVFTLDLNGNNVAMANGIKSITNTYLPDGSYTFKFTYSDIFNHGYGETVVSNVTLRRTTPTPILTYPQSGAVNTNAQVAYMIPVQPLPGSVELRLYSNSISNASDFVLNNVLYRQVFADIYASNMVISLYNMSGTYHACMQYVDILNNPPSSACVYNAVFDLETLPPVLSEPLEGVYKSIPVAFTLPETPLPGSVELVFEGTETYTLSLSSSMNAFVLNPKNIESNVAVLNSTHNSIPSGEYAVSLRYKDIYNHSLASSSSSNIVVDTLTQAALLVSPLSESTDSVIYVDYILPETPLAGTVRCFLTGASSQVYAVDLPDTTEGSFVWDPVDGTLVSLDENIVFGDTIRKIDDGVYALSISYQDMLGNPSASTLAQNVVVQTPHVSVSSIEVHENDGEASLDVALAYPSRFPVTVSYSTHDGTALDGRDYTASMGNVSWVANEQGVKRIAVLLLNNKDYHPDTAFSVSLSTQSSARFAAQNASVLIHNDDPKPLLYVLDKTVSSASNVVSVSFVMNGTSRSDILGRYRVLGHPVLENQGNLVWQSGEYGEKYANVVFYENNNAYTHKHASVVLNTEIPSDALVKKNKAHVYRFENNKEGVSLLFEEERVVFEDEHAVKHVDVALDTQPSFSSAVWCDAGPLLDVFPRTLVFDKNTWDVPQHIALSYRNPLQTHSETHTFLYCTSFSADPSYHRLSSPPLEVSFPALVSNDTSSCGIYTHGFVHEENNQKAYVRVEASGQCPLGASVYYAVVYGNEAYMQEYQPVQGSLAWEAYSPGVHEIEVPLIHDQIYQEPRHFSLVLFDAVHAVIQTPSVDHWVVDTQKPSVVSQNGNSSFVLSTLHPYATLSWVLSSIPLDDVVFSFHTDAFLHTSEEELVFTQNNWNVPQSVVVSASDEAIQQASHVSVLDVDVESNDAAYDGFPVDSLVYEIPASLSATPLHPSVHVSDVFAQEDEGSLDFTLKWVGNVVSGSSVSYSTYSLGALVGVDYSHVSGRVLWNEGDPKESLIQVPLLNNNTYQENKRVGLLLESPENIQLYSAYASGVISDDDAPGFEWVYEEQDTDMGICEKPVPAFIVLKSTPTAAVTVSFYADDRIALSKTEVVITPQQASVPVAVQIQCRDASDFSVHQVYAVIATTRSEDAFYNTLSPQVMHVSVSPVAHPSDGDTADDTGGDGGVNTEIDTGGAQSNSDNAASNGSAETPPVQNTEVASSKRSGCAGGCAEGGVVSWMLYVVPLWWLRRKRVCLSSGL